MYEVWGEGGGTHTMGGGGVATRDTEPYIYIIVLYYIIFYSIILYYIIYVYILYVDLLQGLDADSSFGLPSPTLFWQHSFAQYNNWNSISLHGGMEEFIFFVASNPNPSNHHYCDFFGAW